MDEQLQQLADSYQHGGWFALIAGLIAFVIRIYRSPQVQGLLPDGGRWEALPKLARQGIVFLLAFISTWITARIGGQGFWAALIAAFPVAFGAIAAHKFTKAIGHEQTRKRIRQDPEYAPSRVRRSLRTVLPIDDRAITEARKARPV